MKSYAPLLIHLLAGALSASGAEPPEADLAEADWAARDLTALSIEELMELEVTSVSRKEEKLSQAGAAIHVITQEDIRRSGIRRVPELLRLVPGLEVARINANQWAITSRGFNGRFANKLLVLIDGRSVYTPLFSGVYWELQDVLLEDVDRIEVIRGPGATMWGANAVNGVINIITKKAHETQGGLITAGGGTEELAFGAARYGGKLGEKAHFRLYGTYQNHDDFVDRFDDDTADEWESVQTGGRVDWEPTAADLVTVQGDVYGAWIDGTAMLTSPAAPFMVTVSEEMPAYGGNLLGRWSHVYSETSQSVLQLYYQQNRREAELLSQREHTLDAEFEHRFRLWPRHEILWGLGYRLILDDHEGGFTVDFDPRHLKHDVISAFLQDEVSLVPDRLRWTIGSKFEHNSFTGFEIQPNTRLVWTPHARHTAWAAVSRAVRTPSRAEEDLRFNSAASSAGVVRILGNRDFESEDLLAFEVGYRVRPHERLSLDFAAFYNLYDNVMGVLPQPPFLEATPPPPHAVQPLRFENALSGETFGVEIAAQARPTDWWTLSGSYTFLELQMHQNVASPLSSEATNEGGTPRNQASLRSGFSLPYHLELDVLLFYVDHLAYYDVPSYLRLDVRLGWRPWKNMELSVGGQNLLDDRHPEFGTDLLTNPAEVERAFYGVITWRF